MKAFLLIILFLQVAHAASTLKEAGVEHSFSIAIRVQDPGRAHYNRSFVSLRCGDLTMMTLDDPDHEVVLCEALSETKTLTTFRKQVLPNLFTIYMGGIQKGKAYKFTHFLTTARALVNFVDEFFAIKAMGEGGLEVKSVEVQQVMYGNSRKGEVHYLADSLNFELPILGYTELMGARHFGKTVMTYTAYSGAKLELTITPTNKHGPYRDIWQRRLK